MSEEKKAEERPPEASSEAGQRLPGNRHPDPDARWGGQGPRTHRRSRPFIRCSTLAHGPSFCHLRLTRGRGWSAAARAHRRGMAGGAVPPPPKSRLWPIPRPSRSSRGRPRQFPSPAALHLSLRGTPWLQPQHAASALMEPRPSPLRQGPPPPVHAAHHQKDGGATPPPGDPAPSSGSGHRRTTPSPPPRRRHRVVVASVGGVRRCLLPREALLLLAALALRQVFPLPLLADVPLRLAFFFFFATTAAALLASFSVEMGGLDAVSFPASPYGERNEDKRPKGAENTYRAKVWALPRRCNPGPAASRPCTPGRGSPPLPYSSAQGSPGRRGPRAPSWCPPRRCRPSCRTWSTAST